MSWTRQSWTPEQPRFVADLTGNGKVDIAGFGLDGIWVSLNNGDGTFQPPNMVLSAFGFHTGWRVENHPRFVADLTGDGRADILGFGDAGVWTAVNNGNGTFQPAQFVIGDLGYNQGWRVDQHPRFVADLTGNGRADVIGFGNDGVWTALSNGDGTFQPATLVLAGFNLGQGWQVAQNPRLLADVNGDGKADIVGFGNDGVWVALSNGDGTFQPAKLVLAGFNPGQGWQVDRHPRMLADLNGDGCADIVGFGDAGVWSALSDGTGGFLAAVFILANLGYNNGWQVDKHPRFAADVTADGKADIIGFGDDGVWVSVTGGSGVTLVLAGFCYNQGWRVDDHPRFMADLNGDGKADIIGFGDAGIWIALSNGDGTFQPAAFVLADFGYHSGPVLQTITLALHTQDDDLDNNTLLNIFVKNRSSDSSNSEGPTDYIGNFMAYQEHDADWYSANPYLGFARNASNGQNLTNNSTTQIDIPLRSKPIPLEEIVLPVVNIHILTHGSDTWKFDYTITFTLDDGRQFPWSSNINGITGFILDQDNLNYSGICQEIQAASAPTKPATDSVLTGVTIEFNTHNDDKNSSTQLNIHIVNRLNDTSSQDISVATDLDTGQTFPDSGDTYKRLDLPLASNSIFLRDIVLPVVYINIAAGTDKWIFDYRVTFFFGQDQPYSWKASGIVLDQDRHKHMGVYNGRSFPTLARPQAILTPFTIKRNKAISLAFIQQKLQELFNSRQGIGGLNPLVKLRLDNTGNQGDQVPQSYLDTQFIENDPPPPDGAAQPQMGVTYGHSPSVLGQFAALFGDVGVQLNDINSESLTLNVNPGDNQTPLTLNIQFETGGAQEITGTLNLDVIKFEITIRLTLRFESATKSVDLMAWIDDLNGITFTPLPPRLGQIPYQIAGTFLGTPLSGTTFAPDDFKDSLLGQVVDVVFTTSNTTDPGGFIQKALRQGVPGKFSSPDSITQVTPRQSINATLNTWLMGGVIQSGNTELVQYPNPCQLVSPGGQQPEFPVTLNNDMLTLNYFGPANSFVYQTPAGWGPLSPGTLANIDHIVVLTQENRSFDHMLGYLSLPYEKGGMNRTDVDGLKGGEFNMLNGRKCESFRLAAGDTIFSPGPSNSVESVALSIFGVNPTNAIKMDSFVQAHANDFGPDTAPRVMGYHTADNVPTYDAFARDFGICQRWFCPHPGPTFPNRFYELTGRPSIDPWGAWDYNDSLLPVFTDTIFDHLTDQGVSWKYFEHGFSFLRFFERHTFDSQNLVSYDDPKVGFEELARTGNLPSVSFIDPRFVDLPPGSTDDEPPSDIRNSQPVIRQLVEALVTSPTWNKTLLIITYDEHGGFYDHVPPATAAKVSDELLGTTGVRVPTFIISPWVKGGTVSGSDTLWFDHTSILKTIARRFMSANPPYMGARYAAANDLSAVVGTQIISGPFRPFIPYTISYSSSQKCLDVEGDRLAPGTLLWQYDPNGTSAQQFSFEDEGDGYVYIRTTTGGFYVTVDAGLVTNATQYGIKLDMKYPASGVGATNPNYQRWVFTVAQGTLIAQRAGTFRNSAFPAMILHPQGESPDSGTRVVLEAVSQSSLASSQYEWIVSNSALSVSSVPTQCPYAFLKGSDGQLWLNRWDGFAWYWTNQATAPAVNIAGSVGVVTVMDSPSSAQRPYAYLVGGDGQLWLNWWNYTVWVWSSLGSPSPGVRVAAGVGVVNVMSSPAAAQCPYAFVNGSDGQLWLSWWDGSAWHWTNLGTPPATEIVGSVGVITVMDSPTSAQRPYAYVVGGDGQLWVNWWDYTAWVWSSQGMPSPGVTVVAGTGVVGVMSNPTAAQCPYAFVKGSDGQLWLNWWDGFAWHWTNQGKPSLGVTIAAGAGAVTVWA